MYGTALVPQKDHLLQERSASQVQDESQASLKVNLWAGISSRGATKVNWDTHSNPLCGRLGDSSHSLR